MRPIRSHIRSRSRIVLLTSLCFSPAAAHGADEPVAELSTLFGERWRDVSPTAEEKAFDRIGWAPDIREAIRLAKGSGRPVFLFTHDGRINTGRC